MTQSNEDYLMHYGILRRSGRYPWGSGSTQNSRNRSFLDIIDSERKKGLSDTEIAKGHGITTTELRAARSIALAQQKQQKILQVQRYADKGMSNTAIGKRMNLNESSVRALRAPGEKDKADALEKTANLLKENVDKYNYLQVSRGVDAHLGVSSTRFTTAIARLKEEGYTDHIIKVKQLGTNQYTSVRVLAKPGVKLDEVQKNRALIRLPDGYSQDGGRSYIRIQPPISVSSRRVQVKYGGEGGEKADGVMYIRPGVKDLSLGGERYGQVRVLVDNTHYLKGMAIYKDDLPNGVDIQFNTKKANTGRKKDALKPINTKDPELPFSSIVRQVTDPKTGKVTSALNIVGVKEGSGTEGSWDSWSRNLSAQMLSKQSPDLAKQQLALTHERRVKELAEINSLTNPTVKKQLLLGFAESTDSAAVHLKAASLPRQATKVILPLSTIKPGEVYVPTMKNGERVALIRYPHAGKFEIPQLTVNNRNPEGKKLLGNGVDVIGIHHSVAQHLSGADFDGDTVLVIPNGKGLVKSEKPLEQLTNFDPMVYKIPKDDPTPRMTPARKGQEMGDVSNLITDMTIRNASHEELSRAVRHSMVVIDAEKHELNYKQSALDFNIRDLKERYQKKEGSRGRGASTLISQKQADFRIKERVPRPASKGGPIDPATGKKVYIETGRTYVTKNGKRIPVTRPVDKLSVFDNAHDLSSHTVIESVYADHSNKLKAMANDARKEALTLKSLPQSPSAKRVYSDEVSTLNAKLRIAKMNAPLEAHAQILANHWVSQRQQANPGMSKDEIKKIKSQSLIDSRIRTGAHKERIDITPKEWEAIQAGAISKTKLEQILSNTDLEHIKKLAMPKDTHKFTTSQKGVAQTMLDNGYTYAEVADRLGVGVTTLRLGLADD